MKTKELVTDPRDIAYIKMHFMPIVERDPSRPAPSYVLEDGTCYVPRDYNEQEIDRERFIARFRTVNDSLDAASREWSAFMTGVYGVCLRSVTPENIARKELLIARIDRLLEELHAAVDALDDLEMPFSPVFDRQRFGRPPSRDTHIDGLRKRLLNT